MGSLHKHTRQLAVFVFIAGSLSVPLSKADKKVQWQDVDQLCGQLELGLPEKKTIIVGRKSESRLYTAYLQDARVTLYHATYAEKECCTATPIAMARSRKYGAFELRAVQPGYYWLQVQKDGLTLVIPVHLTSSFSEKSCSDSSESLFLQLTCLSVHENNLLEARVIITTYNDHVRLLSPEPWLVGTTKGYSGVGADIVMESISLIDWCSTYAIACQQQSGKRIRLHTAWISTFGERM